MAFLAQHQAKALHLHAGKFPDKSCHLNWSISRLWRSRIDHTTNTFSINLQGEGQKQNKPHPLYKGEHKTFSTSWKTVLPVTTSLIFTDFFQAQDHVSLQNYKLRGESMLQHVVFTGENITEISFSN